MANNLFNSAIDGAGEGDRVLFLYIPPLAVLDAVSARVRHGIIVCLGARDAVYEARKAGVHLSNTMFIAADLDEIPWQEGFFNWVLEDGAPSEAAVCREMVRVLAPGGRLWLGSLEVEPFLAVGLLGEAEGALRKPEEPVKPAPSQTLPILQ